VSVKRGDPPKYYVIIEHLEPCISPWLLSEYRYVAKLFSGRVIFTNVTNANDAKKIKELGVIYSECFTYVVNTLGLRNLVILDPQAVDTLTHQDLIDADAVVIGGIMGDHPPQGRTKKLISSKALYAKTRNLGPKQLTIAGAAYVLKRVEEGVSVNELDIRFGLKISTKVSGIELAVELPYAFPYENGAPVLPSDYLDTVIRKSLLFEDGPCVNSWGSSN